MPGARSLSDRSTVNWSALALAGPDAAGEALSASATGSLTGSSTDSSGRDRVAAVGSARRGVTVLAALAARWGAGHPGPGRGRVPWGNMYEFVVA